MKKILNNPKFLILFILIIILIIFFLFGYLIGYYFADKSCIQNPFSYGLKQVNKANFGRLNITCSCFSFNQKYSGFSFDETGFIE